MQCAPNINAYEKETAHRAAGCAAAREAFRERKGSRGLSYTAPPINCGMCGAASQAVSRDAVKLPNRKIKNHWIHFKDSLS